MKNYSKILSLAILGAFAASGAAFAGKAGPRARNQYQKNRIQEGVKSGEITKGEAHHLRREERRIHRAEKKAAADGTVTPEEKARIEKMQNKASADIYRAKHNDRERPKAEGNEPAKAPPAAGAPVQAPAGGLPASTGTTSE